MSTKPPGTSQIEEPEGAERGFDRLFRLAAPSVETEGGQDAEVRD